MEPTLPACAPNKKASLCSAEFANPQPAFQQLIVPYENRLYLHPPKRGYALRAAWLYELTL